MSTKQKFRADEVVRAIGSFASTADGRPRTVFKGATFRGDDRLVKLHPERFAPADAPASEWPTEGQMIASAVAAVLKDRPTRSTPPARSIAPETPLSDLFVCIRGVLASDAGACDEGAIVAASDPIVALVPEAFAPLASHLGDRS